mmetsp:Transcript_21967/g.54367  ORF Transcript_21967/g.54367 Transcript_21967/m.54367 type:complete len:693 (-) Transcript_21967:1084-3162(-)|eukprot:CAMPEP_0116105422 /NCGR_PEP_ID=MMETSP0327-20121206/15024_1 /TAXON_ID=44447 /ORGANISM="Pseudo-nitzschia delicatissima, Strain B596" /LENGTH=692 /DNA_ID=CAMNT_0003597827 /DNA_START=91 /DNA_END=2169 /DNA_ORIENTATION=-
MAIQGIIRPPPDIRVVADRTAMFVAKNGRAFESRILGSAKGKTPKFAFLQPTSPFHAYYEDRIKHFEAGGGTDEKKPEESKKDDDDKKAPAASKKIIKDKVSKQKASIMDPVAKAILGQRSVITNHLKKEKEKAASEQASADGGEAKAEKMLPLPAPPVPLDTVHVVAPYHLTPTQIETIQLVAQFVAMDGKGGPFLPALVNREWSNPDFGFCQPRNIHFSYFSALVDAYRKIIADFVEAAKTTETTIKEKAPAEGSTAETTTTYESTKPLYDVQSALNDAAYRTEYERELERRRQKHQENSNAAMEDGEIANAIDWHDFVVVETIDFPIEETVDAGLSMLPTKAGTTTATTTNAALPAAVGSTDMDMEESSDEDDEADNIRVVPSYTPKVVGTYDPSTARAVDPLTGKSVAVSDMPEHMRIQLLDPKWAEERKKFQDKQKDSNLVGGDAVVANIARMSQKATAATTSSTGNTSGSRPSPSVSTAPIVGPARTGQHSGFRGPPSAETEQPPSKRQRTVPELPPPLLQQQQKHKVTIAPPLVTQAAQSSSNNDGMAAEATPAITDPVQAAMDPPPMAAPPLAEEKKLLTADEFIATLGENPVVELQIRIPNDAASQNWNFFGQTVTLERVNPRSSVKEIKEILSKQHLNNMPVNKIQIKSTEKFLSNSTSLAALNIGPTAVLELKSKQRGGRK